MSSTLQPMAIKILIIVDNRGSSPPILIILGNRRSSPPILIILGKRGSTTPIMNIERVDYWIATTQGPLRVSTSVLK